MTAIAFVLMAGLSLFVGILIGSVGIGGMLLVPGLAYLFGMPVQAAIAAAMFSYLFSGAVGAVIYARRGSIHWALAGWIFAGAAPGAVAGAALVSVSPGRLLEFLIAALVLFAGFNSFRRETGTERTVPVLGRSLLIALGALTGLCSALTGTGGPLLLIPVTLLLGFPPLAAVGLGQAIQIPIATFATLGNIGYGTIDWLASATVAVPLAVGVAVGAKIAHAIPRRSLQPALATVLLAVGVFMILRLL